MSTSSKAPARAFALVIVIAAMTAAIYFITVRAPSEAANKWHDVARKIGKDFDDVFNFRPRVTSGGITLLNEKAAIKELSTTERRYEHTYYWESIWMGSKKRIELKGNYVAKAGYDLSQPFSIDIAEDGTSIRAQMPPARIHSMEQIDMKIIKDENGLWNKIKPAEREKAINALMRDARKTLEQSDILEEADKAFMTQLEETVRRNAPSGAEIIREAIP
jgi:hypothetical protein